MRSAVGAGAPWSLERFDLSPHPSADRLCIATLRREGARCVVPTEAWPAGADREGLFVGPGAVVDVAKPHFAFLARSADATLSDGRRGLRVAPARIRGEASCGVLIPPPAGAADLLRLGDAGRLSHELGVEVYEPPPEVLYRGDGVPEPENFARHSGFADHSADAPVFVRGDRVRVTEFLAGASVRVGLVYEGPTKTCPRRFVGSSDTARDPDGANVFSTLSRAVGDAALERIPGALGLPFYRHLVLYLCAVGGGLSDLRYAVSRRATRLLLCDASVDGRYLDWYALKTVSFLVGVQTVPLLHDGVFSEEALADWRESPSVVAMGSHGAAGCVVTSVPEGELRRESASGAAVTSRKVARFVSDAYARRTAAEGKVRRDR